MVDDGDGSEGLTVSRRDEGGCDEVNACLESSCVTIKLVLRPIDPTF